MQLPETGPVPEPELHKTWLPPAHPSVVRMKRLFGVACVRPYGGALAFGRTTPEERLARAGDSSLIAGRGRTHGDLGLGLAVFQDVRGARTCIVFA